MPPAKQADFIPVFCRHFSDWNGNVGHPAQRTRLTDVHAVGAEAERDEQARRGDFRAQLRIAAPYFTLTTSPPGSSQSNFGVVPPTGFGREAAGDLLVVVEHVAGPGGIVAEVGLPDRAQPAASIPARRPAPAPRRMARSSSMTVPDGFAVAFTSATVAGGQSPPEQARDAASSRASASSHRRVACLRHAGSPHAMCLTTSDGRR